MFYKIVAANTALQRAYTGYLDSNMSSDFHRWYSDDDFQVGTEYVIKEVPVLIHHHPLLPDMADLVVPSVWVKGEVLLMKNRKSPQVMVVRPDFLRTIHLRITSFPTYNFSGWNLDGSIKLRERTLPVGADAGLVTLDQLESAAVVQLDSAMEFKLNQPAITVQDSKLVDDSLMDVSEEPEDQSKTNEGAERPVLQRRKSPRLSVPASPSSPPT